MCIKKSIQTEPMTNKGLQRYVSEELTHFVGMGQEPEDQYNLLVTILKGCQLHPHGFPSDGFPHQKTSIKLAPNFSSDPNELLKPTVVCFCDIPIADMRIHMAKYSNFGLSFLKSLLVQKGANPVFYVAQNSFDPLQISFPSDSESTRLSFYYDIYKQFRYCFSEMPKLESFRSKLPILDKFMTSMYLLDSFYTNEFWSFIKFFDTTKHESHTENYYMEREWRILGRLDFSIEDVHRIILPKSYASMIRHDVPDYCGQIIFADYI
jgi:hypothetical protein